MAKTMVAIGVVVISVILAAGGGIALGQSMRKSDGEVARMVDAARAKRSEQARRDQRVAVRSAVAKAKRNAKRQQTRLVRRMRADHRRELGKARDEAYSSGSAAGYASGNSAGYSSGHEDGQVDGLIQGSDSLTCSDDPDVTWLPWCG